MHAPFHPIRVIGVGKPYPRAANRDKVAFIHRMEKDGVGQAGSGAAGFSGLDKSIGVCDRRALFESSMKLGVIVCRYLAVHRRRVASINIS